MIAALALAASLLWGTSDFAGGLLSRRRPVLVVIELTQVTGFVVVLLVAGVGGGLQPSATAIGWGLVSGVVGTAGVVFFYAGLASGAMGIVAPIVSMSTAVPVFVGFARGERPQIAQLVGIAVAVLGILLVATPASPSPARPERHPPGSRRPRRASGTPVVLALASAVAFGLGIVAIAEGSTGGHGSVLMTLTAQRAVSVLVVGLALVVRRTPPRVDVRADLPLLCAVGLLDLTANGSYAYATQHGLVSVVSVLSSLYPVVTTVLARRLLAERLGRIQLAGVGASVVGVLLLGIG